MTGLNFKAVAVVDGAIVCQSVIDWPDLTPDKIEFEQWLIGRAMRNKYPGADIFFSPAATMDAPHSFFEREAP